MSVMSYKLSVCGRRSAFVSIGARWASISGAGKCCLPAWLRRFGGASVAARFATTSEVVLCARSNAALRLNEAVKKRAFSRDDFPRR
jgi:hypothetical protein